MSKRLWDVVVKRTRAYRAPDIVSDAGLRQVVRQGGWVLAGTAGVALLEFAQAVALTRSLGAEGYGRVVLVITVVTVLAHLTSFRMNEFVVKYLSDALERRDSERACAVVKMGMGGEAAAAVLAFCVLLLIAPICAEWFLGTRQAGGLVRLYALTVMIGAVSESATGILHTFGRFRWQSIALTVGRAATLVAVLVALGMRSNVSGVLSALVVGALASASLLVVSALWLVRAELGPRWWKTPLSALPDWRSVGKFAVATNLSATLSLVTKESDVLWLGLFRNAVEVGYYRGALLMATLLVTPIRPLTQTIYPELARMAARRDWARFQMILGRASALVALYIVPASIGLLAVGSLALALTYGRDFVVAVPALAWLVVGMSSANIAFWNRPALLALGRADYAMKVNMGLALLKLAGVLTLVPRWGYTANATILCLLYVIGGGICVWRIGTELRQRQREPLHAATR